MNVLKAFLLSILLALSACAVPVDALSADAVKDRAHAATVRLDMDNGVCSATAVGRNVLLTATHCLRFNELYINGTPVEVRDRVDDGNDHTLLWVNRSFFKLARINTDPLEPRAHVYIWGNPDGLKDVYREGVVASIEPPVTAVDTPLVLIDMNIFQGDSGAGVFNEDGEVTAVLSGVRNSAYNSTYAKFAAVLPFAFTPEDLSRATR